MSKLFILVGAGFIFAATVAAAGPTVSCVDDVSVSQFIEHDSPVFPVFNYQLAPLAEPIVIDSVEKSYHVSCAYCADSKPKVATRYARYRARSQLTSR